MKGFVKKSLILLLLFLGCNYPAEEIFANKVFTESNQNLSLGISYLNLRKSFLDFPIVWKSSMPVVSASYQMINKRFSFQISLLYGRSTYIDVNDCRKWGKNYFYIFVLDYDLLWHKLRYSKNPKFFWSLGATLENIEVVQKIEISSGKYDRCEDQCMGIGPKLNLLWKFNKVQLGFDLCSIFSIPFANSGIKDSDIAITNKSNLWWFEMKTNLFYKFRVSKRSGFLMGFNRNIFVYGRTQKASPKPDNFYSGGSYLFRYLEIVWNYDF